MDHIAKENDYEIRPITSLKDMLDSSAVLYAENPAYLVKKVKGGEYVEKTYKKLKSDVDALGTKLIELGLKDAKIAIIGENCYQWIATYYAVVNGVGTVVPLDKELNMEEVQNLISIADCQAVFYTASFEKYFENSTISHKFVMKVYEDMGDSAKAIRWQTLITEGRTLLDGGDRSFLDSLIDPEEVKMLLFTSGTTGDAKAVMLSHKNIAYDIMDTCKVVEIFPNDRTLSILPIHHTFECTMGQLLIIYRGGATAYCEGLKYVTKNMVESGTTVLIGVPLIFESVYDKIWKQAEKTGKAGVLRKAISLNKKLKKIGIDANRKLFKSVHDTFGGKLRLLVTGAAGINPNVCRGFEDLGIRVLQGYGLTECAPLVSGTPYYENTYKKAGSVGKVVRHGEFRIIDKDEDGIGEVLFKGPNVMVGYYNMPEETNRVLKDGWFHTGDLGFLDEEGWLYLTGRKKNVIVTKTGKNIYPEEVEHYLNSSKYIEECMVYGVESDNDEDTLVSVQLRPNYAFITEEFGKSFDQDEIYQLMKEEIAEVNQKLPIYKRIKNIIVREEEFLKTTTKKIRRHKNV